MTDGAAGHALGGRAGGAAVARIGANIASNEKQRGAHRR